MQVLHQSRWLVIGLILAASSACASRSVPGRYPAQSAASPQASAAPVAVVTRALAGDPPLPGEDHTGWAGLAPKPGKPKSSHGAPHHGH